ncbi:MAG: peptidase dimerization domain-containing protein [Gemmatimonadales bacterium]
MRTLQRDLHSGTYGGVAPNAIETLARLLTDLKDETAGSTSPSSTSR